MNFSQLERELVTIYSSIRIIDETPTIATRSATVEVAIT